MPNLKSRHYVFLSRFKHIMFWATLFVLIIFFSISDLIFCQYCRNKLMSETEFLLSHGKSCSYALRPDRSFLYVCLFCNYHSNNSGHMRGHIRRHIGDKPYKCQHCSYNSSRQDNLTTHVRLKHVVDDPI
jgi:hypothetical protein